MTQSLLDGFGHRKYLVAKERVAFVHTALDEGGDAGAFCLTLAITGARISEVLALRADQIDVVDETIIFKTLKQRGKTVFRAVPVPDSLIRMLATQSVEAGERLWPWGRTHAWKIVKAVTCRAGIVESLCKPKALRHAFAVEAGQKGIPLNIVQRWLGHARIETTAIYLGIVGKEERLLAKLTWNSIGSLS